MGTSISSLQFLGASVETVRAALPCALAGQWSERFVTACPDLAFQPLERKALTLSKKLSCTVLAVSMFDGDALSLTLFREGKRLTRHSVDPAFDKHTAGDPKLFCAALGLPPELAPKLKRLFTACLMQEEKLDVLQRLLGAPLFLRHDSDGEQLPSAPLQADAGALEKWVSAHPEPPKIKNQCRAELLQELCDRGLDYSSREDGVSIFTGVHRADEESVRMFGCQLGEIVGQSSELFLVCPQPDGHLELAPLEEPSISEDFIRYLFDGEEIMPFPSFQYASLDGRLVTAATFYKDSSPFQTVLLRDSAGILPCCLSLTLEGTPVTICQLRLLSDGGFLMTAWPRWDRLSSAEPFSIALARFGPDGAVRWTIPEVSKILDISEERIYAIAGSNPTHLLALDPDGTTAAEYLIPIRAYGTSFHILGGTPYILEPLEHQKDSLLRRLTPDLRPDGEVLVPSSTRLAPAPDGRLLYAAGRQSGLRVIDTDGLRVLHDLPRKDGFHAPITDGQNRLWVGNGGYFECYTPELECISRHRLKGNVCQVYSNAGGQVCVTTFQQAKYIIRVYRFS